MEGVLEEVLAVHSVIVRVCMCMWDPDELMLLGEEEKESCCLGN